MGMALRAERHPLPGTQSALPVARRSPWLSVARLLSSVLNPDLAEAPPALMVESGCRRAEHDKTPCNVGRGQTWDGPRGESCTTKARRSGGITGSSWVAQAVMALRAKRINDCAPIPISGRGQRSRCLCASVVNLSRRAVAPPAPMVTPGRPCMDYDKDPMQRGDGRTMPPWQGIATARCASR